MRRIRIERAAKAELRRAIAWYDSQQLGLGSELHDEVDSALVRLAEPPEAWATVPGVPTDLPVRRVILARFPYAIVFVVRETELIVIAFAHFKKRPGYWLTRVR